VTIVRDYVGGRPSYLCYCERSSGQFLFDTLMDAGNEFGVDADGYPDKEI
jgi:sarcosine oxidase subunit alpha